jgi:heptosyltransferase-3
MRLDLLFLSYVRSIERWFRDHLHRGVTHLLPGPTAPARIPNWDERPYRVLVLRYDVIGDLVLSTGMLRQIALAHPTIEIDVLARTWVVPVLDGLPFVRRVIPFDCSATNRYPSLRLLSHVRRQRYDVVVDGMSIRRSSPTSSLMFMLASRAPYRVGLASATNSFFYNLPVDPDRTRHHAEQSAVLAQPFGLSLDGTDWRSELAISAAERHAAAAYWSSLGDGLRLFVNISVTDPRNDWPDERFIEVLRRLLSRRSDLVVVVSGIASQTDRIVRIARESGAHSATQSLREVIARIATSDLVLTPDTGIVHIAAAFQRPIVGLYRIDTRMWAPYHVPHRALHSESLVHSIPVDRVTTALDDLLDERYGAERVAHLAISQGH